MGLFRGVLRFLLSVGAIKLWIDASFGFALVQGNPGYIISFMETDPVRQELLQSARNYFTKFGFSRVSTNEIAASAGRSKKTLYKHFGNKEDLLREVLSDIIEDVESEILEQIEGDQPFEEMAHAVLVHIAVHESSLTDVLIADLKEKSPILYQELSANRDETLIALLGKVFAVGEQLGLVRSDVQVEAVFRMFLAGIKQYGDGQALLAHAANPGALFSGLARVVIDGLLLKK